MDEPPHWPPAVLAAVIISAPTATPPTLITSTQQQTSQVFTAPSQSFIDTQQNTPQSFIDNRNDNVGIPRATLRDFFWQLCGPNIQATLTRTRQGNLEKQTKVIVPSWLWRCVIIDNRLQIQLDSEQAIFNFFGAWARRTYESGTYVQMRAPVSITYNRDNEKVSFKYHWGLYNEANVLQYPI